MSRVDCGLCRGADGGLTKGGRNIVTSGSLEGVVGTSVSKGRAAEGAM